MLTIRFPLRNHCHRLPHSWVNYTEFGFPSRQKGGTWLTPWEQYVGGKYSVNKRRSLPVVKRTMALRQLYSAESTWRAFSFSTCSWNILIWSMKATTLSAAIGDAWSPAAASSGATCRGIEHWDAFSTNSSLHTSLNRATWSVTCRSGKKGMFRAHSTAENNSLAANSQMLSIPMMLFGCIHWPYRDVG